MSRIDHTFARLKERGQSALIPFIMAGDPDLKTTEVLVSRIAEAGADMIELGVPFSDPIADGPTIQSASERALQNGVNLKEVLSLTERLKGIDTPLILMTYFNPVFRYGLKDFAEACQRSGVDGVIIPDLVPEEAGPWVQAARRRDLDTIFLIAPTSPPDRIGVISRCSRGFIYYVSVTGVTGARERLPEGLEIALGRIRDQSRKPVAVGFGISTPEQARSVGRLADGVIVGSAIVKMIEENLRSPELTDKVRDFVSSIARTLKS
ncbi:MAG: tryptophan synthase subunit alpha [Syntrophaceae bacterium]|nr:tryptophan synthase subunit alpha [Syntrophaceae bacterium]